MPLRRGSGVSAPTPTPTTPPRVRVYDTASAEWIAPNGDVIPLTQESLGWFTLDSVAGLGSVSRSMKTDADPRGGANVRNISYLPRVITWPIAVLGSTHGEFLDRWRAIGRAFTRTSREGPGILRVTQPDGTQRQISAYYQEGWEPRSGGLWRYGISALSLFCGDPFWSAVTPITESREYSNSSAQFLNPFMTVSSSRTLGDTVIVNSGDDTAYPTWTIEGPMTSIEAVNHTTGKAFTLTYTLVAGETVTITTRPPSVLGPAGQIITSSLNRPGATLWGLDSGDNDVSFIITGSGAGTRITWSYYERYETL